ncbi:undecaprenyl-diphosphatase [Breoghania corrubedonensis]|uniref:Undecaprenyl-diphosphatase n=1 Tax=Breoghania corrubedonensis TaxID=665038 RepID=A0A2T5V8L5_9HYPH|nr:phosphatase PAP2 family protein [Breoghania corrubedonensis]PTW60109.1 undecaprenyl-diphosphatase [Breoghania corrubedonensis]
MNDKKQDGSFGRITDGETMTGLRARLSRAGRRMRANAKLLKANLRRRHPRAARAHDPLPPGHRPQDLLAILLLSVGIAVIALDRASYPWIHSLPRDYTEFFRTITDIGKSHWMLWTTGLFLVLTMALDWRHVAWRTRASLTLIWTYCAFIFFSIAASGVIALVLKWCLGRPRPKLFETVGPLGFDFLAFNISYTSFPSGHATSVAALAASLCLIFPAWLWLIAVCGFWLIFSRIMVGAHYPSDVIAGTLLGVSVTLWTARYMAVRHLGFAIVPGKGIRPIAGGRTLARAFSTLGRSLVHARLFGGERLEPVRPNDNETQSDDR